MNLMGKTVVEIEEFVALRNAKSANEAKTFLSKLSDRIRIPYEKYATDVPRTCIFIGTLNERTFLNDHTGERRYLPVECNPCLLYTSPSPRDGLLSRMPSSA